MSGIISLLRHSTSTNVNSILLLDSNSKKLNPEVTEDVVKFFKTKILNSSCFFPDNAPSIYDLISRLIHNEKTEDNEPKNLEELIALMIDMHNAINNPKNRTASLEIENIGRGYLDKCNSSLFSAIEYLLCFYDIEIIVNENNKRTIITKSKTIDENTLLKCFSSIKHLEEVQRGYTKGLYHDLEIVKDIHSLKNNKNNQKQDLLVSLGGIEKHTFFQRLFSLEFVGTILFTGGLECAEFIPVGNPHLILGIGTMLAMAGFGLSTVSDSSITFKLNLYKKLFSDMFAKVKDSKNNNNEKFKITENTKVEFEKIALLYSLNNKKINDVECEGNIISSVDAEILFDKINQKTQFSFQELMDEINEFAAIGLPNCSNMNELPDFKKNRDFYLNYFRTKVRPPNEYNLNAKLQPGLVWGTMLDQLFLKLDPVNLESSNKSAVHPSQLSSKEIFLNDLKNPDGVFGSCYGLSPIPGILAGNNGAIQYVTEILNQTDWGDRIQGTRVFSELMMNIYSSKLSSMDKLFLLKIILKEQLDLKDRGAFAAGIIRRESLCRNMFVGSLYTLSSIASYIFADLLGILKVAITFIVNGLAAMAFGFLGYNRYAGTTASHASKNQLTENALLFIENIQSNNHNVNKNDNLIESENFKIKYFEFTEFLKVFKQLKNKNDLSQGTLKNYKIQINNFIDYFNRTGATKFVFEFNHKEIEDNYYVKFNRKKNNPLFEILDVLTLKKEFDFVDKIILKIFEDENIQVLNKKFKASIDNVDQDLFNQFMRNGFKNSATPQEAFLFSLQCSALFKQMENKVNLEIIKECQHNFFQEVKEAAFKKASPLFILNQQNLKTYRKRQVFVRFIINFSRGVLSGVVLGIISPTSSCAFVAAGFALALLSSADFMMRKYAENLKYNLRIETKTDDPEKPRVLKNAHRNYELVRKLAEKNGIKSRKLLSMEGALKRILAIENKNLENILEVYNDCITDLEKKSDNEKANKINDELMLNTEIHHLLKQGIGKESVQRSLIRAQRLIILCDEEKVSKDKKLVLLDELAFQGCLYGPCADVLQAKGLLASGQYLMADFFLGFLTGSFSLIQSVPFLQHYFLTVDAENHILQNMQQHIATFATCSVIDIITLTGWFHEMDVSLYGRTKSFKDSIGGIKEVRHVLEKAVG